MSGYMPYNLPEKRKYIQQSGSIHWGLDWNWLSLIVGQVGGGQVCGMVDCGLMDGWMAGGTKNWPAKCTYYENSSWCNIL